MEKKKFKNGDKILINPKSEYKYQGLKNGKYLIGTIIDDDNGPNYTYRVEWENKSRNAYRSKDLIPYISTPTELNYEIY